MENTQATQHKQLAIRPRQHQELPRPGASLMSLPVELLIEICTYLCYHGQPGNLSHPDEAASPTGRSGQVALSGLAQACRLLRTVAEPFLFHHVRLLSTANLHLFIRSLVERPELRLKVCEATIKVPLEQSYPDPGLKTDRDIMMAETIEEPLIAGDWAPLWNLLVSENRQPNIGTGANYEQYPALSGLLLRLAPNLKSISFCGGSPLRYDDGYTCALSRWNAALPATSVTRLSLIVFRPRYPHDYDDGFGLGDIGHILQAVPNLEVLHLHGCNTAVPEHLWRLLSQLPTMMPAPMENLTELVLIDCHVTIRGLANLTKEAVGPNLSRLIIRQGERPTGFPVQLELFLVVLKPWTQTLRELTYRFSYQENDMYVQHKPLSLLSFHALEVLDITTHSFTFNDLRHRRGEFAQCLPPSIRKLRLAGSGFIALMIRGILVARKSGRLLNLATIEVNEQDDWDDDSLDFPGHDRGGLNIIVHPFGYDF